eukprot:6762260-Alexandrium_andersonii.AAC.1
MGSRLPSSVSAIGRSHSEPNGRAGRASQRTSGPCRLGCLGRRPRGHCPSALAPTIDLPRQSAGGCAGRGTG